MTAYRLAILEDDHDLPFVLGTWASSYKNAHHAGFIQSEDWPAIAHDQLGKILARPTTRTIVAYEPPNFLYGFITGDTSHAMPVVHYVYVKDPYRSELGPGGERIGPRHARGLFAALGVDPAKPFIYTFRTAMCALLADRRLANKIPLARFTPGAARYSNYQDYQEKRR